MKKKIATVVLCLLTAFCCGLIAACKKTPVEPEPEPQPTNYEYALSATSAALAIGQTTQLSVTVTPDKTIAPTYATSDDAVATVSDGGLVTAIGKGTATITVTVDEQTLTCAVTVYDYTLNFIELELERGQTKQLGVLTAEENVTATYATSNEGVATVSSEGLVTAAGVGTAGVTATVNGVQLTCKVTVREKYAYALDTQSLDLAVGDKATVKATVTPVKPDYSLTYTSEDETVATVGHGTGIVTAVGAGTTRIACMIDGHELFCSVTVTEYALSDTALVIRKGETATLTVSATPDREMDIAYESLNEEVATVSGDGTVTAVAVGDTTVKVTVNGKELTCAVTVNPSFLYALDQTQLVLEQGDMHQLEVRVTPEKPDMVVENWQSSMTDVATVDNGLVSAIALGEANITVSADGQTLSCSVKVVPKADLTQVDATGSYNLTMLHDTDKTLDWRFYGDSYTDRMADNADLIGEAPAPNRYFGDYKASIHWGDGTTTKNNQGRTDGRVYVDTVKFDVTVNNNVQAIMLFVGAYNATNKVSFIYDGETLETYSFTSSGSSVNKVLLFAPDTTGWQETAAITVRMEKLGDNADNISMVAVAVVGNTARPAGSANVSFVKTEMNGVAQTTIDLTTKGTADWYYTHFLQDDGDRKSGGSAIRVDTLQVDAKGDFWDYRAGFTWTDGTNWETNPQDQGENWGDGVTVQTNNGFCGSAVRISVSLTEGSHTVYLYASGWKSTYAASVYDANETMLSSSKIVDGDGSNSKAYEVAFTLDVQTAGDYVFVISMIDAKGGNVGLAAIAVA